MKRGRWIVHLMLVACLLMLMLLFNRPASDMGQDDLYPQRVIALSAGLVETIYAIGEGNRVVGISRWTQYPPQTGFVPHCGDILEPNYDRILALKPDLLMLPEGAKELIIFAREHDIPVASYSLDSPLDVTRNVMHIGLELGNTPQAIALGERIDSDLKRIRTSIPKGKRPRVALILHEQFENKELLSVAGGEGYLDKMLSLSGADNALKEYESFAKISFTDLERLDPDVIVVCQPATPGEQDKTARQRWAAQTSLRAVRDGKLKFINGEYLIIPGPRFTQAAYSLLRAIHGESVLTGE